MADAVVTKTVQEALANRSLFGGGPTSQRPQNPPRWFHYFDTDLNYDVVWDGSQWRDGPRGFQGPSPQGSIGFQGFQGHQGFQGPTGGGGMQGPMGAQGRVGSAGPAGERGFQGAPGVAVPAVD